MARITAKIRRDGKSKGTRIKRKEDEEKARNVAKRKKG